MAAGIVRFTDVAVQEPVVGLGLGLVVDAMLGLGLVLALFGSEPHPEAITVSNALAMTNGTGWAFGGIVFLLPVQRDCLGGGFGSGSRWSQSFA